MAEIPFNFNYEMMTKGVKLVDKYGLDPIVNTEDRCVDPFGVCDNFHQILDHVPEIITSNKKYVIGIEQYVYLNNTK